MCCPHSKNKKIFIPHYWRCNVHTKLSEDSGVPLCPLIIHQFVVICVFPDFCFCLFVASSTLSLSLWVSFDVVGGERQAFLNFCQFMLKSQTCTPVHQLGEITGFSKVFWGSLCYRQNTTVGGGMSNNAWKSMARARRHVSVRISGSEKPANVYHFDLCGVRGETLTPRWSLVPLKWSDSH